MSRPQRFFTGIALGIAGPVALLFVAFVGLEAAGMLKAPALANRLSFDEKIRHFRNNPPAAPDVLLVGSSTTLHGVDAALLGERLAGDTTVLNFGVQGLRVHQYAYLTEFLLARLGDVKLVATVATLDDFWDCSNVEPAFFDASDTADYLFGGAPETLMQFRYLDLQGVAKYATRIADLRVADDTLESVNYGADGSLLLDVDGRELSHFVREGLPINLDPACYAALERFVEDLEARGIDFVFALAPMRPGYLASRDPDGALLADHRRDLKAALANTGALLIDAHGELALAEPAFFDAYHIMSGPARAMTRFLAAKINAHLRSDDDAVAADPRSAVHGG